MEKIAMIHKFDPSVNVCSFLILPMVGLNVLMLGGLVSNDGTGNFINSVCSYHNCGLHIEIELKSLKGLQFQNNHLMLWYKDEVMGTYKALYLIPKHHQNDATLIMEGKFTKIQASTVDMLCLKSGLAYKVEKKDSSGHVYYVTHKLLMAISKDAKSRELLAKALKEQIGEPVSIKQELYSAPYSVNEDDQDVHDYLYQTHPANKWR